MSTENETQTGAPRTAGALIQEAARVVNWRPDEKYSLQARYDAARAMASMYAYWTIVSLETLRRVNPDLAEAVTTHIDDDLDWPNAHEHAYGWEQTLDAGKPIPVDAWPFWEISGQPADEGCLGTQRATGLPCRCPSCTQPAGEHRTPIDDWPEIEGTFDEVLERAAKARLGDGEHHTGTLNLTGEGNEPGSHISDEMVLAAANAVHAFRGTGHAAIRDALEAAYPAIRQQVAEEIATECERRSKIADRDSDRRSGVREGMVVTWLMAEKVAREIGGAE